MISKEEILKIGKSLTDRIIKIDIIEYDKFLPEHEVEFKLSILDIVYSAKMKPENVNEQTVNQVWIDLFSSFLAAFNSGLSKK